MAIEPIYGFIWSTVMLLIGYMIGRAKAHQEGYECIRGCTITKRG